MIMIFVLIPTGNTQHAFVYHRSESLLLLLVVMVSTVAQILLLILGKLHPAQHLHSQPVVNHLRAPLTVRQAQLGRALPENTNTPSQDAGGSVREPSRSVGGAFKTYQELLLSLRSQRADAELQSTHRQGVCRHRNAEALVETHLGQWLQGCAAVKRAGPAGVQRDQVDLHIPEQAGGAVA